MIIYSMNFDLLREIPNQLTFRQTVFGLGSLMFLNCKDDRACYGIKLKTIKTVEFN